jgi:hypothetical protein
VLIDGDGRPVCSAMWPSNTRRCHQPGANDPADAPAFSVGRACIVADCGMISAETIAALEARHCATAGAFFLAVNATTARFW